MEATPTAPPPSTTVGTPEWVARNNLEREVLRGLRQLNFRFGQQRVVVIVWNGTRAVVLPTEQLP